VPVKYRPADVRDLGAAEELVIASINDLTVRHGFGPMATASPPSFQLFSLKDDPDGLWIAEDGGEIVGFAWSWACGELWFLAQLFVDPAQQGRGIGNELLKLSLEHARQSRAAHKALITFTFNRVSQGLYIRHGLFPRMPIYFLGAKREQVTDRLPKPPLESVAINDMPSSIEKVLEIDSRAIGVSREKHHRYLLNDPASTGVLLYAGSDCVGYGYVASSGHIGPLAVTRTDVLGDAFTTVLAIAARNGSSENLSAFVRARVTALSALPSITGCGSHFRCC
jgi:ribosomal protein S18 acetylase RimI-like enzyme